MDVDISDVDKWHKARGWGGVGYHYFIKRDGTTQAGRPLDKVGAHVKGHNYQSWGVCLAGGLDDQGRLENNFTLKQMDALDAVVTNLKSMAPQAVVLGHRDLSPDVNGDGVIEKHEWIKDCPCFEVRDWWVSR